MNETAELDIIAMYNKLIQQSPRVAPDYLNRGVTEMWLQEYKRAKKDFNRVIKLQPDNAEGYNARGCCYKELRKFGPSLRDYNKAVLLKPKYALAYYNRGLLKLAFHATDAACLDFEIARQMGMTKAERYLDVGCK
jgi:tetratricopeptide (TPR) repeat protein